MRVRTERTFYFGEWLILLFFEYLVYCSWRGWRYCASARAPPPFIFYVCYWSLSVWAFWWKSQNENIACLHYTLCVRIVVFCYFILFYFYFVLFCSFFIYTYLKCRWYDDDDDEFRWSWIGNGEGVNSWMFVAVVMCGEMWLFWRLPSPIYYCILKLL